MAQADNTDKSQAASTVAEQPQHSEKQSAAVILNKLDSNKAWILDRDGQPVTSAGLKRVADRVNEARLRCEHEDSKSERLQLGTLLIAGVAAIVGLSIAETAAWGVATQWALALVAVQVVLLGFLVWIGFQLSRDDTAPWAERLELLVWKRFRFVVTFLISLGAKDYPIPGWVVPEAVAACVAAGLLLLGIPLEHPPIAILLLTAVPLLFCAAVFSPLVSLPFVALVSAGVRLCRYAPDPVDPLIGLLYRWTVGPGLFIGKRQWVDPKQRGRHRWGQEPHDIWEIEEVAQSLETDFASSHVPWGCGAAAWAAAQEHGNRIAAWLRLREDDLLMSVPGVRQKMGSGLLAVCDRRWPDIEAQPPATRPRRFVIRMVPRLALAAAVGAAAIFLPDALGLEGTPRNTLTVSLAIVAINALITPSSAISKALEKVGTAFGGS